MSDTCPPQYAVLAQLVGQVDSHGAEYPYLSAVLSAIAPEGDTVFVNAKDDTQTNQTDVDSDEKALFPYLHRWAKSFAEDWSLYPSLRSLLDASGRMQEVAKPSSSSFPVLRAWAQSFHPDFDWASFPTLHSFLNSIDSSFPVLRNWARSFPSDQNWDEYRSLRVLFDFLDIVPGADATPEDPIKYLRYLWAAVNDDSVSGEFPSIRALLSDFLDIAPSADATPEDPIKYLRYLGAAVIDDSLGGEFPTIRALLQLAGVANEQPVAAAEAAVEQTGSPDQNDSESLTLPLTVPDPPSPKTPHTPVPVGSGAMVARSMSAGRYTPGAIFPGLYDSDAAPVLSNDHDLWLKFQQYDTDGSGTLNKEEFRKIYKGFDWFGLGPSDGEIDRLFAQFDLDGSGRLNFDEFAILMLRRARL
eukprot:NODE_1514_length_1389_cov_12.044030_g1259_i0.p1 GENE.NODE_1514_length_1389_cov_12.044030_g1259_i0~~NODE_1514_length_1389_cov_12.044030_g1259_i0.p1  ORF type:complete len:415 (+),score=76.88 NODE_1514_length_1389_cov_12.044030_g1259_i0:73-1317(+)